MCYKVNTRELERLECSVRQTIMEMTPMRSEQARRNNELGGRLTDQLHVRRSRRVRVFSANK